MNNIWFTADTHFGHKRIIELTHRPFKSVDEMDSTLIDNWNSLVKPGDFIYHLGDFAFAEHTPYLEQLNGHKRLIIGNHDHSNRVNKAKGWATINDMLSITLPDDTYIVLCHYALRVWNRSHHGALHFYGHSHGNLQGDSQSCDVGVDCWHFRPVSIKEIMERLASQGPRRAEPDHHKARETIT